jgi:hypothetical protein
LEYVAFLYKDFHFQFILQQFYRAEIRTLRRPDHFSINQVANTAASKHSQIVTKPHFNCH